MSEMPPYMNGTVTGIQLRHLNRVLHYAIDNEWRNIIEFDRAFLKSIELGNSKWDSWEAVQVWHKRHLESGRYMSRWNKKPGGGGGGGSGSGNNGGSGGGNPKDVDRTARDKKLVEGVPESFLRLSKLCIRYQSGTCPEEENHTLPSGTVISHSCAICLKKDQQVNADHGAHKCPKKKSFLQSGGGRGAPTPGN